MEREQHERAEAAENERRKNRRAEQDAKVALARQGQVPTAAKRWQRKTAAAKPKAGWHRVLPKLADLARDVQTEDDVGRSADKDVNQRRRRVVEKLLTLGPDRRVALPQDWRLALDELEAGRPNVRAPIRSIRNALPLASATETAPRIPPQLLLGAPGLGKTHYSHRVAEIFGSTHAAVQFDQPSAGWQRRGCSNSGRGISPGQGARPAPEQQGQDASGERDARAPRTRKAKP